MIKSALQQILTFFRNDALCGINQNISLLELARFRTLLNERKDFTAVNRLIKKGTNILNFLSDCRTM